MLRMRGHVSVGFFRCDIPFLQGKHNGFHHIVVTLLLLLPIQNIHFRDLHGNFPTGNPTVKGT